MLASSGNSLLLLTHSVRNSGRDVDFSASKSAQDVSAQGAMAGCPLPHPTPALNTPLVPVVPIGRQVPAEGTIACRVTRLPNGSDRQRQSSTQRRRNSLLSGVTSATLNPREMIHAAYNPAITHDRLSTLSLRVHMHAQTTVN